MDVVYTFACAASPYSKSNSGQNQKIQILDVGSDGARSIEVESVDGFDDDQTPQLRKPTTDDACAGALTLRDIYRFQAPN